MADVAVFLNVLAGPDAPRTFRVEPGTTVRIGRAETSDLVLTDPSLSRLHFTVSLRDSMLRLRDESSRFGTFVNGTRVTEATLRDGDIIEAGVSRFAVRILVQSRPASRPSPAPTPATKDEARFPAQRAVSPPSALGILRSQPHPLFVVLDAARDPLILALLNTCSERFQSLYEGLLADQLVESAPYLVSLPSRSPFLETLATQGWGKSWGILLVSPSPFETIRKHLRRFLTINHEGGGQVVFRFYDPRVLSIFLPSCTPGEARDFFGPVQGFLVEGDGAAELRRFSIVPNGLRQDRVSLTPPPNLTSDHTIGSRNPP
ncbi:DUF4123 domain-containing protein [Tautonia sp. JC769]|uniref:DUF4123 domain-containing protein n=1 Tax=Tautonia sp. JC769 TaxID=3232135 RepID=UPI0034596F5B